MQYADQLHGSTRKRTFAGLCSLRRFAIAEFLAYFSSNFKRSLFVCVYCEIVYNVVCT